MRPLKSKHGSLQQPVLSERTRRSIKSDLRKYKRAGSKRKTGKAYNNVVHSPIWDIELTHFNAVHACRSYFHLLLGIVTKHHDLLERDCHYLDKQLAQSLAKEETPKPHRHQPKVQDKCSAFSEASSSIQNGLDRQCDSLSVLSGPVTANLDVVLKEHKICIQAYHSRSFIETTAINIGKKM